MGSYERLAPVFQCYLDDSGTSGLPIVTMAGFAAHVSQWKKLEPALNDILNRYEVPILHTKQFHDTDDCFKGWKKIKKRSFADEIFSAAHGRIKGFSITIKKDAFSDQKNKTGKLQNMSAYGVCFSTLMMTVLTDSHLREPISKEGLAFLVESGNKNNSEIKKFFDQWSRFDGMKGRLRALNFVDKKSCRAIQIADFLAFYSRRQMHNQVRFSGKLTLPQCAFMEIIKRHVPIFQKSGAPNLQEEVGNINEMTIDDLASLRFRN